jgi:hypothetical protein
MNHSTAQKTLLCSMALNDLDNLLSSTGVPLGCRRTRTTLLAAEFLRLYGDDVAIVMRTPPQLAAVCDVSTATLVVPSIPWLSVSVDDLTCRLEKLTRSDI